MPVTCYKDWSCNVVFLLLQIVGKGFNAETFIKEAIHYTFPSSLFDTVVSRFNLLT